MYKFRKTKIVKALSVATGLVVGLTMVANSVSAMTMTLEEAEAKIAELSAMIAAMQAAQQTTPVTPVATGYTFSRNLKKGDTGADVLELQKLLNTNVATQVAATGVGSAGEETEYFGSLTKAAVVNFQDLYADEVLTPIGLTTGTGYVGTMTLAKLNALSVADEPIDDWYTPDESTDDWFTPIDEPIDDLTGPVTVSLADSNPVGAALVALQAGAKIADFKFSGTGTITSVTLKQSGFSTQDALTNVYLYDGATRLTDGYTFNSAGNLVMNNLNIAVAGERVISVKADVVDSVTAHHSTIVISLVGYTADGVAETTQVNGNMVQFVAGSLAGVTLTMNTVTGTPTVNAGTMNYTIWGNSITVSTRSVNLGGAIFKIIGSAPGTSFENVRLMIDGVQAGEATTVDATGNVVFAFSATPIALATGSHTVELRADIVGGSNRSFYVSLGSAGDIVLADTQYSGSNTSISSDTFIAANYNSVVINIGAGTISLTKDTTFDASTNVTSGASNIAIAKYKIKAYGEDMKVKQVIVTLTETATVTPNNSGLNNVGVYVNGGQVGSSQNLAPTVASLTYNLGSALIIPAGTEVVIEVRTDLTRNDNGLVFLGAIATALTVPASQAQGMSSQSLNDTASVGGTTSVTSSAVSATVAKSLSVSDQTVSGNTTNKLIGEYVIQAGTTEGVRVTNLAVAFMGNQLLAGTGAIETTDIANLTIAIDGGATMTPVNPSATNNFSVDFTVAKGTSKTVRVYADITAATDTETITTTLTATARGAVSNTAISLSAITGQTMTVGSGSLAALTIVSSTETAAQYLIGGTSARKIITYNITSTGGDSTIQEMTFDIGASVTGAITSIQVAGNQGGTSCSASMIGTSVTLTGCAISVPMGYAGTALTVTANLGTVGMGGIESNASAFMDIVSIKYTNGVTSVTALADGTDLADVATSSTMKLVASVPTFTLTTAGGTLTNGEVKVGTVNITANAGGNVNLNILPVSVTISGGATLAASTTVDVLVLKEGSTVISTTDDIITDGVTSATATVTLDNDFVVSAGTTRTLDIYAYFSTVAGGDDSAQISLAAASTLDWDDISGNGTGLTGTLISTYPTNAVTIND